MPDTAAPVIDSVSAPSSASPGDLVQIVVSAHDADARSVTTAFELVDGAGNRAPGQATIIVGDPVTIDPASVTVTDPANSATAAVDTANPLAINVQF